MVDPLKGVGQLTNQNTSPSLLRRIWNRLEDFRKRTITIGAALPPYVLIGILFVVQQRTNAANEDYRDRQVQFTNFKDCVETGRARQDNKEVMYGIFTVVRGLGAAEGANALQLDFDTRFDKKTVKQASDCLELPEFKGKFTEKDYPPER